MNVNYNFLNSIVDGYAEVHSNNPPLLATSLASGGFKKIKAKDALSVKVSL